MGNKFDFEKWIRTFWEEKGFEEVYWNFEYKSEDGLYHLVPVTNEHFLEVMIQNLQGKEEAKKVRDMLVKIDFKNGDCMDFIHYLAKNYYAEVLESSYISG